MASVYYGVNTGAMQPVDVTESGSTTSSGVELVIDLSKVTTRIVALQCLEAIKNYLVTKETDPIA
jgi:hypothetical protein